MAEGNAAIHAARGLFLELLVVQVAVEFIPMLQALDRRVIERQFAKIIEKSSGFAHGGLQFGK